ncbi:MAG: hypothetical protein ORN28_05055 [Rhodoferax sp.]|nr:hypothetical protein [Rhodoferax sp.]
MPDINFRTSVQLILQASVDGMPHHEVVLSLGETPGYLVKHGFPKLALKVKGATLNKAHFEHGITRNVLERLGDILTSPKALYKSATVMGTAVVITYEQKNGSPILVPIHANRAVGRERANIVASIYNKEATIEARWQAQGLLLWKE